MRSLELLNVSNEFSCFDSSFCELLVRPTAVRLVKVLKAKMLPAVRLISRSFSVPLTRHLSYTPVRRMPFAKHEIVPDVIPVAPKDIATVNYVSGGDYSTFFSVHHFGNKQSFNYLIN